MKKKEFEHKTQNFELPIHYTVEQKATIQCIKVSKGVEPIPVTRQEIVVLPKAKPIVGEGVPMAVKVKYSEPKFD
jgi:hypothetical protein